MVEVVAACRLGLNWGRQCRSWRSRGAGREGRECRRAKRETISAAHSAHREQHDGQPSRQGQGLRESVRTCSRIFGSLQSVSANALAAASMAL